MGSEKESEYDCLERCLSTLYPFATSLPCITSQSPHRHTPNSAFHPALFSRASYPECVFSRSGLSGIRAPHLCCISAPIKLSTTLLVSHKSGKWPSFSILLTVSQHRRLTLLHQTYSEQSETAPTSLRAVKQLGLFSYWCIRFTWDDKL